ncbi:MAG: SLBB domain-containing protein, partial [Ignavibacteria bacterium]|nr:SLBB domain-containing protein [Ignavibacteria bacterium]
MLSEKLKEFGVVGAGGAGFPTYVKANSKVEYVIANGAECEPLIHKDLELMKNFPEEIISGLMLMVQSTQAISAKFGIKEKNSEAVEAVQSKIKSKKIELTLLGDFYPSGDEYELVNIATGRLIPPAGIPLQVGCVVNNVETLLNVQLANENKPVIKKFITVTGVVNEPKSFWIPVGSSFKDAIEFAGGSYLDEYGIFVNGIMMGTLSFDLDDVITKTTAGLILLPKDHYLITRKNRPQQNMNRIG